MHKIYIMAFFDREKNPGFYHKSLRTFPKTLKEWQKISPKTSKILAERIEKKHAARMRELPFKKRRIKELKIQMDSAEKSNNLFSVSTKKHGYDYSIKTNN